MTGRLSVVVGLARRGHRAASFTTRNWCRPGAIVARFSTGVLRVLALSLLAFSPVGAQACHGAVLHDAQAMPASHTTLAVAEQLPGSAVHSPAMHQVSQTGATAPAMHGPQACSSDDCCDGEGEGREPSCPSSCPVGGSCTMHGSVTILDADRRVTAPASVNSSEPRGVGEYADSWSASIDTPPPRS